MESLKQRKLFVTREFELGEKGLKYRFRSLTTSVDVEIPYEEISTKRIDQRQTNNAFLIFTAFMFVSSAAKTYYLFAGDHDDYVFTLVVILIFIFSLFLSYFGNKSLILIEAVNPKYIIFFSKRPDEDTVESFIRDLQLMTKNFLIKKYAERDPNIPIESQLERISILKNMNIITGKEYEELTNKLTRPQGNPIGFGKGPSSLGS